MKRFLLTVLSVSVFFIGIGSIIEKTSAKFTSDEKALEIIKQARIAIGGDANLAAVESMSIVANSTHFFEKDGIQNTTPGKLEINMQLPNQFSKMVKVGDAENNAGDVEVIKEVDVVVSKEAGDAEFISDDGTKKGVFVIKRGDGETVDWKSDTDGKVKVDGNRIIIKKDDGTTEEIKIEGKKRIKVTKDADGNILTEDIDDVDGDNTFVFKSDGKGIATEDVENINGNKVIIMKDADGKVISENMTGPHKIRVKKHGGMGGNEMLRTTIALLVTAPEGMDVSYKFAGMGNVDGNTSNIIDVTAHGSSFKLYIDASTNLPQMISYQGHKNVFFMKKKGMKDMPKEEIVALKEKMRNAERVEHQIKFSDFRSVGNLLMPHRWTESKNGKLTQNIDITSIEINPANIADKFKNKKMFVRKMKSNK